MDKIGRRQTMALGFVLWSLLGFIIGGAVFPIMKILPLFIVLYGIFNGLGEMGPGVSDPSSYTSKPLRSLTFVPRSLLSSAVPNHFQHRFVAISSALRLQWENPEPPSERRSSFPSKNLSLRRAKRCRELSSLAPLSQ